MHPDQAFGLGEDLLLVRTASSGGRPPSFTDRLIEPCVG